MKSVKCPECQIKLAEINEKDYSVIFEKGVEPMPPTSSANHLLVYPFVCPKCNKMHMETIVVHS